MPQPYLKGLAAFMKRAPEWTPRGMLPNMDMPMPMPGMEPTQLPLPFEETGLVPRQMPMLARQGPTEMGGSGPLGLVKRGVTSLAQELPIEGEIIPPMTKAITGGLGKSMLGKLLLGGGAAGAALWAALQSGDRRPARRSHDKDIDLPKGVSMPATAPVPSKSRNASGNNTNVSNRGRKAPVKRKVNLSPEANFYGDISVMMQPFGEPLPLMGTATHMNMGLTPGVASNPVGVAKKTNPLLKAITLGLKG